MCFSLQPSTWGASQIFSVIWLKHPSETLSNTIQHHLNIFSQPMYIQCTYTCIHILYLYIYIHYIYISYTFETAFVYHVSQKFKHVYPTGTSLHPHLQQCHGPWPRHMPCRTDCLRGILVHQTHFLRRCFG